MWETATSLKASFRVADRAPRYVRPTLPQLAIGLEGFTEPHTRASAWMAIAGCGGCAVPPGVANDEPQVLVRACYKTRGGGEAIKPAR